MEDPSSWVFRDNSDKIDERKHVEERAEHGFSTYDWWNFDQYLAWVISNACKRFRAESKGFPGEMENQDAWNSVLLEIEEGFEAHLELSGVDFPEPVDGEEYKAWIEQRREKFQVAMELFAKYFGSLWD